MNANKSDQLNAKHFLKSEDTLSFILDMEVKLKIKNMLNLKKY